ncbi:MAG: PEP-CTERM sorting domain-containing protein [Phycisphaeraceae bacterium]
MKYTTPALLTASLALLGANPAAAAIDGDIAGDGYGPARAVQGVQTQFGDNFSELNAAYAKFQGGNLNLALTGNIENNFNKVIIFIDSVAGGQSTIDPLNNPANFDSLIGDGFANAWESNLGNTVFDVGFEPDYVMIARRGSGKFDFDFAAMNQTAVAADEFTDAFLGFEEGASGPLVGVNGTFEVGYDNSNVAGVAGGEGPADQVAALAVTTGLELSIPLSSLGNPNGAIKVTAWVTGGNYSFNSNQYLASLELEDFDEDPLTDPTRGNVGEFYDISVLPGTQFFTIVNGDTDGDGDIDDSDLGTAFSNYTGPLAPGTGGKDVGDGDTDGDGDVDDSDLGTAFSGYTGPLGPAAVPEPTSLALLSLGGLMIARRRRA